MLTGSKSGPVATTPTHCHHSSTSSPTPVSRSSSSPRSTSCAHTWRSSCTPSYRHVGVAQASAFLTCMNTLGNSIASAVPTVVESLEGGYTPRLLGTCACFQSFWRHPTARQIIVTSVGSVTSPEAEGEGHGNSRSQRLSISRQLGGAICLVREVWEFV